MFKATLGQFIVIQILTLINFFLFANKFLILLDTLPGRFLIIFG